MKDVRDLTLGQFLMYGLTAILLIYSAARTYNILIRSVPEDMWYLALIGIAGLDGSVVVWTLIFRSGTRTNIQRYTAGLMVLIALVGITVTNTGDYLWYVSAGKLPDELQLAIDYGVPAIILASIFAGIVYHLADPQAAEDKERLKFLNEIRRQTNELRSQNAAQDAQDIARRLYERQRAQDTAAVINDGHQQEETPDPLG